ncbi:hypothetical protein CAI21_14655 [Alkalilimnicola ehrlichii]|uniref:N-acetyltransferase domain-containing protein n=1 Tax=Alkalilimnicola ehrlichii TaxID=351052 RepID=A0A3E0WN39_9GAMM|nr:GNAT family N-acetyltransferase [Alkalilimnicola ehrlichii]RFA27281.1 hypothetical protein CAI21_14655 [Alkalilimnicola ehrlichii]RFA34390.1 hypothetical protein CAL65_15220 [Alkalilimnicola ehrlichii]
MAPAEVTIRKAAHNDVPTLRMLAEQFVLANLSQEAIDRHGFLVSNFSETAYREFIDRADHFYVIDGDKGVEAFILAYSSECIKTDAKVDMAAKAHHPTGFILIKQICVSPSAGGKGYGRTLYDWVREQSGGRAQYAAIVLEPYNAPSIRFHEKLGFHKVLEVVAADGMPRGVWARPAAKGE